MQFFLKSKTIANRTTLAFCLIHCRTSAQGQDRDITEPTQWTSAPWKEKASSSSRVSYLVLQAPRSSVPHSLEAPEAGTGPPFGGSPSSRQECSAWCRTNTREESLARLGVWGPPDCTPPEGSCFLAKLHSVPGLPPPSRFPPPTYLKDGVGVVVGLYVIQAHDPGQVSGTIVCPGQLGLLVQVSDLLLCERGLQHVLQSKRKS